MLPRRVLKKSRLLVKENHSSVIASINPYRYPEPFTAPFAVLDGFLFVRAIA
jgi:hypothetical protein